ncbi:MAG: hypothetical protein Q9171_001944 [Xanthocarpia ochracea]
MTNTVDVRKRAPTRRHTLANGWTIHYRVISVIYPVISSMMELRTLYAWTLDEIYDKISAGDRTGPVERFKFGKAVLEFRAERGYSTSVGWYVVKEFAEKMLLEGEFPMTYTCHIAPPGSDVGIQVTLSILL